MNFSWKLSCIHFYEHISRISFRYSLIHLYKFQKESKHTCSTSASEAPPCAGCGPPAAGRCSCARLVPQPCSSCATRTAEESLCKKCDTAKTLALENSKTKCKLEQLRLVMQQKKQRREARKLKTLPYTKTPPKIPSPEPTLQEEIETRA